MGQKQMQDLYGGVEADPYGAMGLDRSRIDASEDSR